ncbi:nucleotidyltransferase domain-containing protein [Ignisphaera sp. 4213-co]|uniref:Nucleotidyltransferase domain-containing protein n=1 Tax=Ignisphaera cupida TaxID=3050454 RepID=A0ABD4Z8E2_9CREN|nr:nucleotidyltransferase domain-containing protein [Ignisphaera sp. 4213-co]MDK6028833.1 nucleotidyltransferase domain-containing protein [Ignisphaera sp. 4213-co]
MIVKRVVESYSKTLKALVLFGSYVYNPLKSRDIDTLLIVDKLVNAKEKLAIEVEVARNVKALCRKPVDVIVFDIDMLKENAEPGGIVSGLVIGYKILYDDIGMQKLLRV